MQLGSWWDTWALKAPLLSRPLTAEERRQWEADRRTADAFRVRRAHIGLASVRRLSPTPMAQLGGGSVQTVRHVLPALTRWGVEGLERQSKRPKTVEPVLKAATWDRLPPLLQQSPRLYGRPTEGWTLALAAEVCEAQGIPARLVRDDTLRRALKRLETHWKRAQHWLTSPDPHDARKQSGVSA